MAKSAKTKAGHAPTPGEVPPRVDWFMEKPVRVIEGDDRWYEVHIYDPNDDLIATGCGDTKAEAVKRARVVFVAVKEAFGG